MPTHDVVNQPPAFGGYDLLASDPAMAAALDRWAPGSHDDTQDLAARASAPEPMRWAEQADRHTPQLRTHDSRGVRIDEVDYHPAYHELMRTAVGAGLGAEPWTAPADAGAHVRRAAGFYLWSQVEAAHLCPISMTYAAAPALRAAPELARTWVPKLASRSYDPRLLALGHKTGAIAGMGMTEKQGGSDVRANTTTATPDPAGPLGEASHQLTGHKWFCSAPMSDAFLVLAQRPAGVTCFLLPRVLPDGTRTAFAIQRLKDKLGNRANASAEVEFDGTWAALVGEDGRGIRTIIEMVAATRLDCILGSAATMRQALLRAVHHTRHRRAFGARLIEQPLMRNVLADLALESEAATLLGLRLAHAVDAGEGDLARIGVAIGKFWVCKRAAALVAEALECLGGMGYVEENGLARLYREAPLNSIWEGSGNVNALDVLRAMTREPACVAALAKEAGMARGVHRDLDARIDRIESLSSSAHAADAPLRARSLVTELAVTLMASLMVQHAPDAVAEAFVASRLAGDGRIFGTLDPGILDRAGAQVLERSTPHPATTSVV